MGLIIKAMREHGCSIKCVDGVILGGEGISTPPRILRHRPDVIGIGEDGQICIGEAKTELDMRNSRSIEQIVDFTTLEVNGKLCEVFFGLPLLAKERFMRIVHNNNINERHLHILFVPEEIINE